MRATAKARRLTLLQFFHDCYVMEKAIRPQSSQQTEISIAALDRWHGSPVQLAGLSDVLMNRFIVTQCETLAAATVKRQRGDILAVWRYAAHEHQLCEPPRRVLMVLRYAADCDAGPLLNHRRVRNPKIPPPNPNAWTVEQVGAIFAAADKLTGTLPNRRDVTKARYFAAIVACAYETGLRKGDLFRIRQNWIRDDGRIVMVQHKNQAPHLVGLTPQTVALVRSIPYDNPLWWPGVKRAYSILWQRACKLAGVPYGLTHQMRRSAATAVWEANPEHVQRFLGHLTPTMWRHYVDQHRSAAPVSPPTIHSLT